MDQYIRVKAISPSVSFYISRKDAANILTGANSDNQATLIAALEEKLVVVKKWKQDTFKEADILDTIARQEPPRFCFPSVLLGDTSVGHWMVMTAYCPGPTLQDFRTYGETVVKDPKPVPILFAAHVFLELRAAVDFLHSHFLAHRNVQEENIILNMNAPRGANNLPKIALVEFARGKAYQDFDDESRALDLQGICAAVESLAGSNGGDSTSDHLQSVSQFKNALGVVLLGFQVGGFDLNNCLVPLTSFARSVACDAPRTPDVETGVETSAKARAVRIAKDAARVEEIAKDAAGFHGKGSFGEGLLAVVKYEVGGN
ncbi:hypothetical protein BU26DRAFT_503424 [Trematosphaeria pertusa]|uniref:Protein kinase domain-containing protein n=1 Tax=Trematosphaeria pertusa TaxID=390896 RepID=A0A6A6IL56_9PLEO|nr:uncharacterized protein BU26DRAFT_503424 [Trematosphaeria pertusa]KAF2250798.1 hypothetical protein BU26DRAFT_503424 [Trematosphaeria pertusa]